MAKMTKGEFIDAVAAKAEVSKKEASKVYEAIVEVVEAELSAKNSIALVGFGTFETRSRQARTGHNPQTGEKINVPECVVPKFRFAKNIKDAVKA